MRLLLDENLDWRLRRDLLDHQVESVPLIGWAGIENGELLRKAAEAGFDVLVTMDSNMVHQQNIRQNAIAVVALRAQSNRLGDTRTLIPALLALLPNIKPGAVIFLPSEWYVEGTGLMKKKARDKNNEMLQEYDFSKGIRGKYTRRYARGSNVVVLEPDVAKVFPNAKAVNSSLRSLAEIMRRRKSLAEK
jgi:predicted nuclease of predicted toxin-antitoxin system